MNVLPDIDAQCAIDAANIVALGGAGCCDVLPGYLEDDFGEWFCPTDLEQQAWYGCIYNYWMGPVSDETSTTARVVALSLFSLLLQEGQTAPGDERSALSEAEQREARARHRCWENSWDCRCFRDWQELYWDFALPEPRP